MLKQFLRLPLLFLLLAGLTFTSCDDDLTEDMEDPTEETEDEDGDEDEDDEECEFDEDLFDFICFDIDFPVTILFPDNSTVSVADEEAFEAAIETYYEANEDTEEEPTLEFPITVTLEDESSVTINNEEEFFDLIEEKCDDYDDDYHHKKCFKLVFPLDLDLNGTIVSVNDKEELEDAVDAYFETNGDEAEEPTLVFPVTIEYKDGTTEVLNSEEELEDAYEDCEDDYDYEEEDYEECFELVFPVSLDLDGTIVEVNDMEELEAAIETYFETNGDEAVEPTLVFPVTIEFEDGTTEAIGNEEDLEAALDECEEDYYDEFEECFELVFPISLDLGGTTVEVNDLEELEAAVETYFETNGEEATDPELVFPFDVQLEDGTTQTVNNEEELETLVEACDG